jgi:hypothetical protein
MTVVAIDDVIKEPKVYVRDIFDIGFQDITLGEQTFKYSQEIIMTSLQKP